MAKTEERSRSGRDSFLSVQAPWWPMTFWLFIGQLALEAVMVGLDERSRLSVMSLVEQARLIRSEIADDILISAVIAIALVDIWRNILVTAEWLKSRIEKREERIRNEGHDKGRAEGRVEGRAEGRKEGRVEGVAEGVEKVLAVLNEEARKDVERKLNLNGSSDSKD